jgi:hypothetical protein
MIIKFTTQIGYFLAEESYKDEIIESTFKGTRYTFKTNEHTFVFDSSESKLKTNGYDIIELDLANVLQFHSANEEVLGVWSKLDHSKKYFILWHYGEGMFDVNNNWKIVLDLGIKVYTSTYMPELANHPNYVYDMVLSFHYFNFLIGSCHIDRTYSDRVTYPKKYKIGYYGLSSWKQDRENIRNWRYDYIDYFDSKSDSISFSYPREALYKLSIGLKNPHFSTPFDFRECNYFITSETHFNFQPNLPYFTSEKILKGAWMELLDINMMMITSPEHMKDLHDAGFWFANSKFIKEYTNKAIIDSLIECYDSNEIIQTNNLAVIDKMLSVNVFKKHNII